MPTSKKLRTQNYHHPHHTEFTAHTSPNHRNLYPQNPQIGHKCATSLPRDFAYRMCATPIDRSWVSAATRRLRSRCMCVLIKLLLKYWVCVVLYGGQELFGCIVRQSGAKKLLINQLFAVGYSSKTRVCCWGRLLRCLGGLAHTRALNR